jgi:hypothetical protein
MALHTSRTIDLPGIGAVLFERSRRAKHINISVRPLKGVRVAVPKGVSFQKAEEVALEKSDWIRARQAEAKEVESQHAAFTRSRGYISRQSAKGIIEARLTELAGKHGLSYNRVTVRSQKTRWGSCSSRKNLSLNYKITLLPPELMDYVLLHELIHTRHFNHSRAFWEELDRCVGDAKQLDKELQAYLALLI